MGANAARGELAIKAHGQTYIMVMDFNAIVAMEQELGLKLEDLAKKKGVALTSSMLRTLFRIGLETHHPDITDRDAGRVITGVGAQRAGSIIGEALKLSFPDADTGEATKTPARPPNRQQRRSKSSASGQVT